MKKDNQRIGIVVLLSTMLFLTIILMGIGYAFFTANNPEGSTAQIISENGRMLITYNDGIDNIQPVTGMVPSNAIIVNKTFSLTGSNTTVGVSTGDGLSMPYKVGVQYTSGFSDGMLHYYIKEVDRPTDSKVTTNYVITPETGKTEDDYKNQTVPGNPTNTGYVHGTFKNGSRYTEMVTGEFPASLNDQTIRFNLIMQFPDNNENQDSEKGKTFNGKIVINYEPPKVTTFAADSWETIVAVVQYGQVDAYPLGAEKEVSISGTNYTVRVANNTTTEECNNTNYSQTTCGFVIEFVDVIQNLYMDLYSNVGGWPATIIRRYLNGENGDELTYISSTFGKLESSLYGSLPEEIRKMIIPTRIVSGHGSDDSSNFVTEDKLFLLSAKEVWDVDESTDTASSFTRQLDYYKNLGVSTSNYTGAIKNDRWYLRTSNPLNNTSFYYVDKSGYSVYIPEPSSAYPGIAPAFRIG